MAAVADQPTTLASEALSQVFGPASNVYFASVRAPLWQELAQPQFCARAQAQKAISARLSTAPWSIALLPWKPGPKLWKIHKNSGLRTWRPCSNQAVTSVWPAAWRAFTCLGMPEQLLQNLSGMQDHSLYYMRRPGGDIDAFHMPSGFCERCCSSPCLHHFNVG